MIVRTQADSASNSESVHEKKRRKRIFRLIELERKGAFEIGSPIQLSVSFSGDVGVREFAMGIGDNPSVSRGVPISLTGDYKREYSYHIDEHEQVTKPKEKGNLSISAKEREAMLNRQGCSWKDIHSATAATNRMIAQRRRNKKAHWEFVSNGLEYLANPLLLFPKRALSSSQKKLLRECMELSKRAKLQYDLQEEKILSNILLDVESSSDSLKSIYIGNMTCAVHEYRERSLSL